MDAATGRGPHNDRRPAGCRRAGFRLGIVAGRRDAAAPVPAAAVSSLGGAALRPTGNERFSPDPDFRVDLGRGQGPRTLCHTLADAKRPVPANVPARHLRSVDFSCRRDRGAPQERGIAAGKRRALPYDGGHRAGADLDYGRRQALHLCESDLARFDGGESSKKSWVTAGPTTFTRAIATRASRLTRIVSTNAASLHSNIACGGTTASIAGCSIRAPPGSLPTALSSATSARPRTSPNAPARTTISGNGRPGSPPWAIRTSSESSSGILVAQS